LYAGQLLQTKEVDQYLKTFLYESTIYYLLGVKNPYLEELFGELDAEAVTDPAAAEATLLGLIRGLLTKAAAGATQETLADILTAMPTGFATADNQTTANGHLATLAGVDFATQTTLAAILAKIITAPATEAKQDDIISTLGSALPAGNNLIGKVGIDGSYTTPTHTAVSVTTSTGVALAVNTSRKYALFINDSDTAQYLKFGTDAVLNEGIRLNANGGSYEMSAAQGNLYTGAVNVIAATAGTLLVTEGA
jgi:hypothetical protein